MLVDNCGICLDFSKARYLYTESVKRLDVLGRYGVHINHITNYHPVHLKSGGAYFKCPIGRLFHINISRSKKQGTNPVYPN